MELLEEFTSISDIELLLISSAMYHEKSVLLSLLRKLFSDVRLGFTDCITNVIIFLKVSCSKLIARGVDTS